MEEVVAASVGQQRLISAMAGVFALLAALLAMVGVFGVMTYNVRRQRREIGIRLALGAERAAVRRLIVLRGLRAGGARQPRRCARRLPAHRNAADDAR